MDTINKKKIRKFLDSLGDEFWFEGATPKKKRMMGFKEFIEATSGLKSTMKTTKNPTVDKDDRHIRD